MINTEGEKLNRLSRIKRVDVVNSVNISGNRQTHLKQVKRTAHGSRARMKATYYRVREEKNNGHNCISEKLQGI